MQDKICATTKPDDVVVPQCMQFQVHINADTQTIYDKK